MANRLGQYQKALRAVGDQRLNSLDENTAPRKVLDDVWDDSILYMLGQGNWKFATRVVALGVDPEITPAFGTKLAYTIPDDFVRLAGISGDPDFINELSDYETRDGNWWVSGALTTLYVKYVSKAPELGLDLGQWPVHFANAHALYMAWEAGLQITKAGSTRATLFQEYEMMLTRARTLEAIGEAVKRKPMGGWTRSRSMSTTGRGGYYRP